MRHALLFLASLSFALVSAQAQEPVYNIFTALDGLAGNTVYCGVQDKAGILWFGTDKGLSRFDGARFENIGVRQGLPDPEVLELNADAEGNLWISCFKKRISQRKNNQILTEKNDSLLAQISFPTSITSFFKDNKGQKWMLGKDYGLYIIRKDQVIHKKYETYLLAMFQIGDSLFGIHPQGICRMSADGDILGSVPLNFKQTQSFMRFNSCGARGNKLLISSQSLLLLEFDGTTFHVKDENPKFAGKIFVDSKQRFWLPSPDHGAILFAPEMNDLQHYQAYLPTKRVNTVVEDSQGGYWFGTIGEGIFRLSPNGARVFSLAPDNGPVNITALSAGPNRIVAGDDKGNLYQAGIKGCIHLFSTSGYNKIRQIINRDKNEFWIGADKGLYRLSGAQVKPYAYPMGIKAMLFRKDTLWIGTASELYFQTAQSEKATEIYKNGRVTTMALDNEGFLWTGGTNGLKCEKQLFTLNWGDKFDILNNRIIALEPGGKGILWAVTPQDGLLKLHVSQGSLQQVEKMAPYFANQNFTIQSLYVEPSGKLWLATNQGVFALNTNNQTEYFGLRDGLTNLEVNCVLVLRDTLWAGTVSGLSCLPLQYTRTPANISLHFSGVQHQLNGQNVFQMLEARQSDAIVLPKEAKNIEIGMTVLDFNGAFNPNFECSISPLIPAIHNLTLSNLLRWINAGQIPATRLNVSQNGRFQLGIELPPGKYEIKGIARSKGGNQVLYTEPLLLIKKPHWYETIWSWLLFIALAAYALHRFFKYRSEIKLMHLQVAELRLLALQAQINPHFIGNSVSAIQQFFYPPDPVKASRYIATLTRLLRKTMEFSDQHFIDLEAEYAYIKDYLDMAQLRFEHRLEYNVVQEPDKRLLFPAMILQPLLENATIHGLARAGKSMISVHFETRGERLYCYIRDNGPGIDSTRAAPKNPFPTHKSVGLELIRKKVKTLNALYPYEIQFDIKDRQQDIPPASGTLVALSLKQAIEKAETAIRHYA